ncbi:HNH endonuclease [Nannocystis sp.]|uniref:HNH endonuclease n=1 Tax=Nannocystis sp. TaxID=1962667 RepID=UPI0025E20024|nr:HNH endonuclease [Nannocystis sp.]MBK7829364.1 hypothetical protein [Nannocystis sp.]
MSQVRVVVCRACRVQPADSVEHVFHSALGGTLKVPDVLCKACNNDLGRTVDAALVEQFGFFRSALEISGDRGQIPEFSAEHPELGRLNIEQGLHPKLGARKPDVQPLGDGTFRVTAANEKIAKEVLASAARKNPDVNVLSAEREIIPPPTVEFRVPLGGEDFRRSCLKVMLVYIEHLGLVPSETLLDAWDYVRSGRPTSSVRISSTPYFSPWQLPATMSEFSHQLLIESIGEGTPLRAALSIFGCPLLMADFGPASAASCRAGVAEDPVSHQRCEATNWPSSLPSIPDTISSDVAEAYMKQLGRVIEANATARDERAMMEMAQLACRPLVEDLQEGDPITEEVLRKIVQRAAALMVGRQFNEAVTLEDPGLLQKLRGKK